MTQGLNYGFQLLDMLTPDGERVDNLIPVNYDRKGNFEHSKYSFEEFYVDKIIALEGAARYKADFVYFREFENRPPLPQIYIYDYSNQVISESDMTDLHRRLWSAVQVPMFYIFTKNEIKIFNAFEAPVVGKKIVSKPLEKIEFAAIIDEKIQEFSAKRIDNGVFWESSPYAGNFKFSGSAYEQLLKELKNTLTDIVNSEILPEYVAKKLLIRSILIKYLEERKDDKGNTVFPKKGDTRQFENGKRQSRKFDNNFFDDFAEGATSFTDVLAKKGACVKLFKYLSKHFNGEIFKLSEEEDGILGNADLTRLVYFLQKKLKGKQFTLWELYSFDDLPIELISNVYEEFLEKKLKRGVVYTPPYLVNFLLEEAMPLDSQELDFKFLDPSCGSGIFLVGAYKRLIYRWRAKNNWKKPPLNKLKKILEHSIYGVDIEPEAIDMAMFSLRLALCDELSPIVIWDEMKFKDLKNQNLYDIDFFKLINDKVLPSDFDLVLGNPPFKTIDSEEAEKTDNARIKDRQLKIDGDLKKVEIPRKQIALLFLDEAVRLCKKETGLLCLILPSTDFLYNHGADKFRTYFLENFRTPQILDFTNLSGCLFGNANVSVIALFSQNKKPENLDSIRHITVRRNQVAEERIFFELDHYDFHSVPFDESISKSFIWKANLFGGGRLARLLNRLNNLTPSLGAYLKNKRKVDKWEYAEGLKLGKIENVRLLEKAENEILNKEESKIVEKLKKSYVKAEWLKGEQMIEGKNFSNKGIDFEKIFKINQIYFDRSRESRKNIYEPPHILIKEVISNCKTPIEFLEDYLAFDDRITGIYAPPEQKEELLKLYKILKNNLTYILFTACMSSEYAVSLTNTTALQKKDLDKLPYPHNNLNKLRLSPLEKIVRDDTLEYWLDYSSGIKTENLPLFHEVQNKELKKFATTFCKILNSVYEDFHALHPIKTENFICYPFYIGEKPHIDLPNKENLEEHLNQLLARENPRANLRITRIMRIYDFNIIYLIKPKQLKYWLRSVAIRDADETFADMVAQEYQL